MKVGRWVMLVIGSLLGLIGLGLVVAGAVLGIGYATQRDSDGFFNTPTERYGTDTYALVSKDVTISHMDDLPAFVDADDFGRVRVRARAETGDVFVGIGPSASVADYLGGVAQAEIVDVDFRPFVVDYSTIAGGPPPGLPGDEPFWVASASGAGGQEIVWDLEDGQWALVVMNADGSAGVVADVRAGGRFDLLGAIAIGLFAGGVIALAIGIPLLAVGAAGLGRHGPPPAPTDPHAAGAVPPIEPTAIPTSHAPYPARLTGDRDVPLSRWLWLVKWLLAIPHAIVLVFLWIAFVLLTVVAGFAILFTGRYPRGIFDFNVGVLRWSWRVGFYAYSALGTDRYPPFTLARTDYPADFDIDYPERLSRGLVIVKWWLLVFPHLLIVAVVGGGWAIGLGQTARDSDRWLFQSGGLISLLVIIAAVALLFTGRYPRGLFDFVIGLNRWSYRVVAYAALMTDHYPPFRLDSGPREAIPAPRAPTLPPPEPPPGPTR